MLKKKKFIKNLIKDKFNTSFIKIFKIKNIKNITILFELSNINFFSKFYILFFKKILFDILIITN